MKKVLMAGLIAVSGIAHAGAEQELQKAINQVGDPCHKVTQVFHNGNDKSGAMHFSVACSGGQNYFVLVNRSGEGKVMGCALMDKIAGGRGRPGSCFTKY
jgi:hypothetical protein